MDFKRLPLFSAAAESTIWLSDNSGTFVTQFGRALRFNKQRDFHGASEILEAEASAMRSLM
jgi:hypothetical protein